MTDALLKAIQADGRSLNALSRASGCDPGQFSRFIRGQRSLTLTSADLICKALGVDVRLVRAKSAAGTTRRKGR